MIEFFGFNNIFFVVFLGFIHVNREHSGIENIISVVSECLRVCVCVLFMNSVFGVNAKVIVSIEVDMQSETFNRDGFGTLNAFNALDISILQALIFYSFAFCTMLSFWCWHWFRSSPSVFKSRINLLNLNVLQFIKHFFYSIFFFHSFFVRLSFACVCLCVNRYPLWDLTENLLLIEVRRRIIFKNRFISSIFVFLYFYSIWKINQAFFWHNWIRVNFT